MSKKPLQRSTSCEFDYLGLDRLRERYQRTASRFIRLPTTEIHCIDEGIEQQMPPVVVLSAQWLGATAYDAFGRKIAGSTRIIRLDLPGHGLSSPIDDGDYSAAAYARITIAAVEALGLDRAVLIGHSHSGIPAVIAALDGQPTIAGLVLATSSGLPRAATSPASSVNEREAGTPDWYRWKLETLILKSHPPQWREKLAAETRDYNELVGRSAEAAQRARQFDATLMTSILPRLSLPGLVLWSEKSTYLPPAMGDTVTRSWTGAGQCTVIPGSGHLLIADAPAEAAEHVLGFLKDIK